MSCNYVVSPAGPCRYIYHMRWSSVITLPSLQWTSGYSPHRRVARRAPHNPMIAIPAPRVVRSWDVDSGFIRVSGKREKIRAKQIYRDQNRRESGETEKWKISSAAIYLARDHTSPTPLPNSASLWLWDMGVDPLPAPRNVSRSPPPVPPSNPPYGAVRSVATAPRPPDWRHWWTLGVGVDGDCCFCPPGVATRHVDVRTPRIVCSSSRSLLADRWYCAHERRMSDAMNFEWLTLSTPDYV